jgi:hypothetical protein
MSARFIVATNDLFHRIPTSAVWITNDAYNVRRFGG